MSSFVNRSFGRRLLLTSLVTFTVGTSAVAYSAETAYWAVLNGANESPANNSQGVGTGYAYIDPVAHTMRVIADFAGLTGNTTACHIHAPTAVAGTGTIGVATTTPTFPGFPLGVTVGTYDQTFDMTQTSSYSTTFLNNNGGTPASAEAALFQYIAAGRAYLNVHSNIFPGGEIRGFLVPFDPTPSLQPTWGRIKSLYR